jgi:hypothetical protein
MEYGVFPGCKEKSGANQRGRGGKGKGDERKLESAVVARAGYRVCTILYGSSMNSSSSRSSSQHHQTQTK